MFTAETFQMLVDIGFVSLVTLACCYTLISRSGTEKKTDLWKRELGEVEQILRALISEASVATRSLDRHLSRRQEELTSLVHKLETLRESSNQQIHTTQSRSVANEIADDFDIEDVPNPTWLARSSVTSANPADSESIDGSTNKIKGGARKSAPRTLNDEIIVSKTAPAEEEEEFDIVAQQVANGSIGDTRLTNPDPIAYKVALRLLRAGKEIHVVARKLSLPLQEIRLLDRLIRATAGEAVEESTTEDRETNADISLSSADILVERQRTLI